MSDNIHVQAQAAQQVEEVHKNTYFEERPNLDLIAIDLGTTYSVVAQVVKAENNNDSFTNVKLNVFKNEQGTDTTASVVHI